MSKKRKTQHQNYLYHLEVMDTFDYESDAYRVSKVFDSEGEAVIAAREYSEANEIDKSAFSQLRIVNSEGQYYIFRQ